MDNPETLTTLGTHDTGRRQTYQKPQHRKLKRWASRTQPKIDGIMSISGLSVLLEMRKCGYWFPVDKLLSKKKNTVNKNTPLTSYHRTQNRPSHMALKIPV